MTDITDRLKLTRSLAQIDRVFEAFEIIDYRQKIDHVYLALRSLLSERNLAREAQKPVPLPRETPKNFYDRYCMDFLKNLALIRLNGSYVDRVDEEYMRRNPVLED